MNVGEFPTSIQPTPDWSLSISDAVKNTVEHTVDIVRETLQMWPNKRDILVFIRNEEDIHETSELLKRLGTDHRPLDVFPLCDRDSEACGEIINDDGIRKVILCTSAREARHVLHRVDDVVDGGLQLVKSYCPHTGGYIYSTRTLTPVTYYQRAACGTNSDVGVYHMLYPLPPSNMCWDMVSNTQGKWPEAVRINFSSVILELKRSHVKQISSFNFMDNPSDTVLRRAVRELTFLGFLDPIDAQLSEAGKVAAEFPIDPQLVHMVLHSHDYHCTGELLSLAALLSVPFVFYRPEGSYEDADRAKKLFAHPLGDHLTLLNVYRQFKIGISALGTT
jgi:pre-mRNA-splicing factor ATP-dependent RNA helicase DHX15/PRP43